jgi:protein SCO1/2
VCPLIASKLQAAVSRLGAQGRSLQLVAVSVDPRGDTPARVASFLRAHRLQGRLRYLLGAPAALRSVWGRWHVAAAPSSLSPSLTDHSSPIYGITASGRMATVYGSDVTADDLVHDVPLLARR